MRWEKTLQEELRPIRRCFDRRMEDAGFAERLALHHLNTRRSSTWSRGLVSRSSRCMIATSLPASMRYPAPSIRDRPAASPSRGIPAVESNTRPKSTGSHFGASCTRHSCTPLHKYAVLQIRRPIYFESFMCHVVCLHGFKET